MTISKINKQFALIMVIGSIVLLGGGFFLGKLSTVSRSARGYMGPGQIDRGSMQTFGGRSAGMGTRLSQGAGEGILRGEVIAKDDKSLTIKLPSGGSKILLLSGTTAITKSALGSVTDLSIGSEITVNGNPNADGSVTARSIQIGMTPILQR